MNAESPGHHVEPGVSKDAQRGQDEEVAAKGRLVLAVEAKLLDPEDIN